MLNVVTVKTGSRYSAEYVNKMRSMLSRHLGISHAFYCLTDNPEGVKAINMTVPQYLTGWWNKLYVFSTYMPPGPLLYLDLDQVITGDITEIVTECLKHPFSCYADHIEWMGVKLGTAFMTLESGSLGHIFENFKADANAIMQAYQQGGDQVYLGQFLQEAYYLNEIWPDAVQSYKFDLKGNAPQAGTRIVNFHGEPKPHQVNDPWITEHWK